MQIDILGKVREKKPSYNNTLLPLFETIVNVKEKTLTPTPNLGIYYLLPGLNASQLCQNSW